MPTPPALQTELMPCKIEDPGIVIFTEGLAYIFVSVNEMIRGDKKGLIKILLKLS